MRIGAMLGARHREARAPALLRPVYDRINERSSDTASACLGGRDECGDIRHLTAGVQCCEPRSAHEANDLSRVVQRDKGDAPSASIAESRCGRSSADVG